MFDHQSLLAGFVKVKKTKIKFSTSFLQYEKIVSSGFLTVCVAYLVISVHLANKKCQSI